MWRLLRHVLRKEGGQALLLVVGGMVAIIGMIALVVDVGMFVHERQSVRNAVDAAALAGAQDLPDDALVAEAMARTFGNSNDSDLDTTALDVTFRCVVGDRDGDGLPDSPDYPAVCDPGGNGTWVCNGGLCSALCVPSEGDTCNTIVVGGDKDVGFFFSPVLSLAGATTCFTSECNTGSIMAAACRGSCGGQPSLPLDVVVIIDRTGSMSNSDLNNAKNAAKAIMELYNPDVQHIALGVLGPARASNLCQASSSASSGLWVAVPLSDDYQNSDGTLNTSSTLVQTTNCLGKSSVGTDLSTPIQAAVAELTGPNSRPDVAKGIILLGDGEANEPGSNPCLLAAQAAAAAKAADVEIFTVGFGVQGAICDSDSSSSPWRNQRVTRLLADMATDSIDETGCTTSGGIAQENSDDDHFLCEAKGGDLEPIFVQAAEVLAAGSKLIQLPEWN